MPTSQSSSKGDVHLHFRHHRHCWKNIPKMIGILPRMRNENCGCLRLPPLLHPRASDNRSIGCREQSPHSGHLPPLLSPLPDWAFTRSAVVPHALPPPSPPRAFSHIILGQLLGIPDSSADVTPQFGRRWVMRGSPRFSADLRLAISEIAAAPPFCPTSPTAY